MSGEGLNGGGGWGKWHLAVGHLHNIHDGLPVQHEVRNALDAHLLARTKEMG